MNSHLGYRFCRKALWIIAVVLTGGVCFLNIFYSSAVASTGYEIVSISSHILVGILNLGILVCLMILLRCFGQTLSELDEAKLFRFLTAVYCVMAAYLILNVDTTIRADARTVFQTALAVKEGDYSAFRPGHYMYRYPHQLGLMLYDQILMLFSENTQFVFFVNFLLVLGINHTAWKISDVLFSDPLTNVLTILLSFSFLPQFFFILFAYGLIPGFFFMLLGFYHGILYAQAGQWKDAAMLLLSAGIAVALKQNFLIGGIAIGIFLFLQLLKEKRLGYIAVIPALILSMLLPAEAVKLCYEKAGDVELNSGSPTVLWIAMGTDIDNTVRGPGWYDSSSWNLYNAASYDASLASDLGKQKLAENWQKIRSDPAAAGKFFLDKTISQWCDPMYESTWSGPLEDCGQYTHTDLLQSVYTGGRAAACITVFMKLLCLGLWIAAGAFLISQGRRINGWEPMYLYFIGGLLFHTFWEGKSQYTYPYLFVLIPFAAFAVRNVITQNQK